MPQPRDNHACVALLDGRVVATGGRLAPGRGYTSSCSTFVFSEFGRLPEDPRKAATLRAFRAARERGDTQGGGREGYAEIQADPARALSEEDWEAFLTQGSWDDEAIPAMTAIRSNHAACVVRHGLRGRAVEPNETIVAVGGWGEEHTSEMYDPQLGRWVVLPCRTNYPRKYHAMAAVDVVRERNIDELFVEWIQEKEETKEKEEKKLKKNGKREEKSTTGAARGKKKGRS